MINLLLAAIPAIGKLFAAGKQNDAVSVATGIAKEIFGTDDEEQIARQMAVNPELAEQFKARVEADTKQMIASVEAETERRIAEIADTQAARLANIQMAQMGHKGYWSGPVIDTIVTTGFFGTLFILLSRQVQLSPEMLTLLTTMVGFLGGNFNQIVNYHRGSSAGSAQKDQIIGTLKKG
jgi:hypothetical protein